MNRAIWRFCEVSILCGTLALNGSAFGATSSSTLLRVSDHNPAYSETVTLTSVTRPGGGQWFLNGGHGAPVAGTVSFYEDNGILLQTVSMTHGIAQWNQKFLGGQHTVYAVYSGNSLFPSSTSATVNLNIKSALAIPANGTYLGIRTTPMPSEEKTTEALEGPPPTGIGRPFAEHISYYNWTELTQELNSSGVFEPDALLQGDISHGRVPVISWSCDDTIPDSDAVIASGDPNEDAVITATAQALAQYPGPVVLRWSWEFNLFGQKQQVCHGDSSGSYNQAAYAGFIGAWQHIWTLFQKAGATNVVFLWNPGNYNFSDLIDQDPHGFYPGNAFVDWLGIDTYQRNFSATSQPTFADNVQPFYTDFTQPQYGGKPFMIGENGSANYSRKNLEVQWSYLQGLLSDFQDNLFPAIKGYCYFDSTGPAGSWVLDDNNGQGDGGLAAFTILGASPLFSSTSLIASSEALSSDNGRRAIGSPLPFDHNSKIAVPIALTNNGLLPVMNAQIDAITNVSVVRGGGSVIAPSGPIPFSTLSAGQTAMSALNFDWPISARCVRMTVQFSANQGAYSGQTTLTVSRFPVGPPCPTDGANSSISSSGN